MCTEEHKICYDGVLFSRSRKPVPGYAGGVQLRSNGEARFNVRRTRASLCTLWKERSQRDGREFISTDCQARA